MPVVYAIAHPLLSPPIRAVHLPQSDRRFAGVAASEDYFLKENFFETGCRAE